MTPGLIPPLRSLGIPYKSSSTPSWQEDPQSDGERSTVGGAFSLTCCFVSPKSAGMKIGIPDFLHGGVIEVTQRAGDGRTNNTVGSLSRCLLIIVVAYHVVFMLCSFRI